MSRFRYRAYDASGALTEGDLETASRQVAIETLHRRGYFTLDVAETAAAATAPQRWWEREVFASAGLPLASLAIFTRELSTLVRAELPLDESLRIVGLQPLMTARVRACTRALYESVRQGAALSAAMAAQGANFPEYYWRLIEAGEASGSLGDVLDDLAGFIERANETRAQVTSALIYPLVLLAAALVTVGVVVSVLVPAVVPLFKDAGTEPPAALRILSDIHGFVAGNWLAVLGCLGLAALSVYALSKNAAVRLWLDRLTLRLPLLGRLTANRETARFARTLATMTRNGVPMLEGVRIAGSVLSNRAFSAAVSKAGDALKEGGTLSQPLDASGLFSELSLRLIGVGEQTGQLEQMLIRVASIYEATVQRQMARFVTLLTPTLTLLIGGLIGSLIISVMGAILSVNDLALQ